MWLTFVSKIRFIPLVWGFKKKRKILIFFLRGIVLGRGRFVLNFDFRSSGIGPMGRGKVLLLDTVKSR